ncbi:Uncharacterised protein [Bordetella pertussis]|nr:Uncharacterised protein [Bordetella pertussis]
MPFHGRPYRGETGHARRGRSDYSPMHFDHIRSPRGTGWRTTVKRHCHFGDCP